MKTIFLVDGAAGTGKSDMVDYLSSTRHQSTILIAKYTTRAERPEEREIKLDLHFPPDTPERFSERTDEPGFYWYTYGPRRGGAERYGFYRSEIEQALATHEFVLIIVRDLETIKHLKNDFKKYRVVSVFVYADRELIIERLKRDGFAKQEIERRLSRQPLAWNDYLKHSSEYDEIVINSSRHEDYEILLEALFRKYSGERRDRLEISPSETYLLVPPLQGFKDEIQGRLDEYPFDRNVFLMMKFRGAKNARVYQFIKRTLAAHGLNCVRADEPDWNITHNTYNPVAVLYCCKYGIALFDVPEVGNEYSPNVAYELGIMHDQGKNCLVLRNSAISNVPFDLVKELYVDYEQDLELEEKLRDWVGGISRR